MKNLEKLDLIYEGKAKKVFKTSDPNLVIVSYKDDATAFNGQKKGTIIGKSKVNNRLTNYFMKLLEPALASFSSRDELERFSL